MISKMILLGIGLIKVALLKLFHWNRIKLTYKTLAYPSVVVQVDKHSHITIGKNVSIRRNCEINARNGADVVIGDNSFLNSGCIVTAHKHIRIGKNVEFGPYVSVFDHDHKFKNGYRAREFECGDINIGDNVWIGTGSIILRGTSIGDNTVIAAGSIVKGNIPSNSIFIQSRSTTIRSLR